jgi:holo-[acyl-carrier protein] synthase
MDDIGIGIDIVDVDQFSHMPFKTKSKFYKKIFNPSEIRYCLRYKNPYEHFAGKFAIKEAVKKSIPDRITLLDIETQHVKFKPHVKLKKLHARYSFVVSVSHEKNLAVAVVISKLNKQTTH